MAVAKYLVSAAVTAVRSATAHDNDEQVSDSMIEEELDQEYRNLRRFISQFAPSIYQTTALFTLVSPTATITKPDDFERLVRMEFQFSQGCWEPLAMRPTLAQSQGIVVDVSGSYQLTYVTRPEDGYTEYDLPEGANRILVHTVSAWVRQRHEEDPTWHEAKAERMKQELRRDLVMRTGAHPQSALQHGPLGYGFRSFYEQGDQFVIV